MNHANELTIRAAHPSDASALLSVYAPYVRQTAITFEYDVPNLEEFTNRIEQTLARYPYLVAERNGAIVGYAYASPFHARPAYDWAVETSIYVSQTCCKCGVGHALHDALEQALQAQGILNMNACIAVPKTEDAYLTRNSQEFHAHLGYRLVGEFDSCGYKFHRWYNMVWMEKHIGAHQADQPAPKTFSQVKERLGL